MIEQKLEFLPWQLTEINFISIYIYFIASNGNGFSLVLVNDNNPTSLIGNISLLSFFLYSVVIWDIMPLWTELCGPTFRLNITWRRLVTRAWTSLRTQWTVWIPVVTASVSWKCTLPRSAHPSNLSSNHIWEMRSDLNKSLPTHPRTYVHTHSSNHTDTHCLFKLHLNTM